MNKNEVLYPTAGPPHVLNWPDVVPKCYVTFVYQKKKKGANGMDIQEWNIGINTPGLVFRFLRLKLTTG